MSGRTALALAAVAVAVTLAACAVGLELRNGGSDVPLSLGLGVSALGTVGMVMVGALIVIRRAHRIGHILIAAGLGYTLFAFGLSYGERALTTAPGSLPYGEFIAWLALVLFPPGVLLPTALLFLLFPDGHLASPRWRPALWATVAGTVGWTLSVAFNPFIYTYPHLAAPFASLAVPMWLLIALELSGLLVLFGLVAGVISLIRRARRASEVESLQIKWFAWAAGVLGAFELALVIIPQPPSILLLLEPLAALTVPVAIGVALFRYRLYDLDRIVSRTVTYALVTALLGAVYACGVVLGRPLIGRATGESDLAVAGSTLAVAALFSPVRRRVQAAVDRRFNRVHYDAARVVDGFSTRLRHQLDLDQLTAELITAVHATVQPAQASLWIRGQAGVPARGPGG
jgi:hypothetical protein